MTNTVIVFIFIRRTAYDRKVSVCVYGMSENGSSILESYGFELCDTAQQLHLTPQPHLNHTSFITPHLSHRNASFTPYCQRDDADAQKRSQL